MAVFKNQTSYITLKGNKINCNATSDDSISNLSLNPSGNIEFSNAIVPTTGGDIIRESGDANYTLRVRDTQGVWEFRNRNFRCMNPANPANGTEMIIHDTGGDYRLRIGSQTNAQVGIGVQYNSSYFLNVGGLSNFNEARVATDLEVLGDLNLGGANVNINNANGIEFYKNTNDVSQVFKVGNDVAYMLFRAWFIDCKRADNDANTTLYLQWNTDGDVRIGNTSAQVAIATAKDPSFNLNVGGSSQFEIIRASNYIWAPTGAYYLNTDAKIYQRADANKSLNIITSNEINFSLQTNKEADPTTATIALQINDNPASITMNRATTVNQTLNILGNTTAEANLNVWGDLNFQHSTGMREVLNGSDYDFEIRNGDTDRQIRFIVGAIGNTPELAINNDSVNLLGHLDITHATVSTSERIKYDISDADGQHLFSLNNVNKLVVGDTTSDVYSNFYVDGDVSYTGSIGQVSDFNLKENIKELDTKKCLDVVKYIKPKEFNYKGKNKRRIGFIAQDWKHSKIPEEYDIAFKTDANEEYLKVDYSKTAVILYGAIQEMVKEITFLKGEITKLKNNTKGKGEGK